MTVERVGVSFEPELLEGFDALIKRKRYSSRSEAIRDLVRRSMLESSLERDHGEILGTLTYIYNHHEGDVNNRLLELQHDHHHDILFTTHVHMDHDMCLEVLIVRGPAVKVRGLADNIKAIKGVKHGELVITRTGI